MKNSNIEDLRRGLVKTLRGLSIAVSDDRLSAELLIPLHSTSGQLCTTHLLHTQHHHYQSLDFILANNIFPLIIIAITIILFHQTFSNQNQISLRIYQQHWTSLFRGNLRSAAQFSLACCVCSEEQGSLWCGAIRELGPPDYQHNCARSHRSTLHIFLPHVLQKHIYLRTNECIFILGFYAIKLVVLFVQFRYFRAFIAQEFLYFSVTHLRTLLVLFLYFFCTSVYHIWEHSQCRNSGHAVVRVISPSYCLSEMPLPPNDKKIGW